MRWLLLAAILSGAGCAQILGISDPTGDACSPFQVMTCDPTDTCDVDPDSELLTCRTEGGLPEYALCEQVGDTCSGALTCLGGVCRAFCDDEHGCTRTGESSCIWTDGIDATVCDDACNVFDGTGCPGALECTVDRDEVNMALIGICAPHGYFGAHAQGTGCTFLGECAPGLGCDSDIGGSDTCLPLCHSDGADCPGTCAPIGRLHETTALGVCRP